MLTWALMASQRENPLLRRIIKSETSWGISWISKHAVAISPLWKKYMKRIINKKKRAVKNRFVYISTSEKTL